MKIATQFWQKAGRHLARYCERDVVRIAYDAGTVCFTFDDVPRSACLEGATILEKYGVPGTYYVCGGLTGIGKYHTVDDLLRLASSGHELASHGFGHYSYQSIGRATILSDLRKNRAFFDHLGFDAPRNFAYPFGHVNPDVKRTVAREFVSCRGIRPGINHPVADVALLKSFPFYEHLWSEAALASVLDENAARHGLLIFFTHGVMQNPEEFDCSIKLLEFAVRTSLASGNQVASMRDAFSALAPRSIAARPQ